MAPDATFCPSCGAAAVLPHREPPAAAPAPAPHESTPPHGSSYTVTPVQQQRPAQAQATEKKSWLLIASIASLLLIAGIFWAALSGFPIEREERGADVAERTAPSVIEEGEMGEPASATSGTIRDLDAPPVLEVPPAQAPLPVPLPLPPVAQSQPPVAPAPAPPIGIAPSSPSPAAPPPQPQPPASQPETPADAGGSEISSSRAVERLASFLRSSNYYSRSADCVSLRSAGYRNVGYTIEVYETCAGSPRLLDRWRVDAKTEEVFKQRGDGRYVRP